jgi:hypothetical protein
MSNQFTKKKIIYVESNLMEAGPINQLNYIINNLTNFSHKLLVLSNNNSHEKIEEKVYLNIPPGFSGIFSLKKILRYFQNNKFDIIHINSSFRALLFLNLIFKKKSRIIYVLRNDPFYVWRDKHSLVFSYILRKIYLLLIQNVNVVFCSKTLSYKYKNIIKHKHCVIQNSINLIENKINKRSLKNNTLRFVVLSRLIKTKNIEFLINAFKDYDFFQNHELHIAGKGNLEKKLIKISGNAKNIFFKGYEQNINNFFNDADIMLSASTTEGLPNSVLEALNNNVPCILSNIPQHKEIYENTNNLKNLIFTNNSADDLIRCIKYLIINQNTVKLEINNLIKNFSSKEMSKKYETFYKKICLN